MNSSKRMFEERTFPFNLLDELICPYCGSIFEVQFELQSSQEGLRDGVLRCDCYEYPVVSGIVVLRQISPVSSTRNKAVDLIKQSDQKGALLWLLNNGSATGVPALADISSQAAGSVRRLVMLVRELFRKNQPHLHDDPMPLQSSFKAALQATRPRGYADYMFHRFANPSLLGAIPPLTILGDYCREKSPGRVLDLLCGMGHTSAILSTLWPEIEVVSVDGDFVNLFLAQSFLAPRMAAICVDAEMPLPFADSSFGGFFCLDGLHYIRSKVAVLREVNRLLSADGIWVFAHMHNASVINENPGTPLSLEGYEKLFSFGQQRFIPESEVLRQYQTGGGLDLMLQSAPQTLVSSHALTLVGARTDTLWKKHPGLDDALCRRPELIGFNPLYQVEEISDGLMLRSVWPSLSLRQECTGKILALPESVCVPRHVVEEIAILKASGSISDDVRKLLRSFVLVSLPECYL